MRQSFKDNNLQKQFDQNGYVKVQLLDEHELKQIQKLHLDLNQDAEKYLQPNFFISIYHPDTNYRRNVNIGLKPILAKATEKYLINFKPAYGNFVIKKNGAGSEIDLHHDWSFVDESQYDAVNVWCPLTNISENNGPLGVIRGSHKFELGIRGRQILFPFTKVANFIKEKYVTPVYAQPGEAIIFNNKMIHMSSENYSDDPRVALTMIMTPAEAQLYQYYHRPGTEHDLIEMLEVDEDFFIDIGLSPEIDKKYCVKKFNSYYPDMTESDFIYKYEVNNVPPGLIGSMKKFMMQFQHRESH
jgi:hypothetical protein